MYMKYFIGQLWELHIPTSTGFHELENNNESGSVFSGSIHMYIHSLEVDHRVYVCLSVH